MFDILPNRNVSTVQEYLKAFPNSIDVNVVLMDRYHGFRDVAKTFLPNAKIAIDRFHVVSHCIWAMDDMRRMLQQPLTPETRKQCNHSRRLLLAHRDKLRGEDCLAVSRMLSLSDDLHRVYTLKERFYHLTASPKSAIAAYRLPN